MEFLEQLELVDVAFKEKKASLIFLHEEKGEIREVSFNKQSYDSQRKEFVDDPEKAEKVEQWCMEYFELPFDRLAEAIGVRRDIYCYEKFNSLFEVKMISKFEDDMIGQIFQTEVQTVIDDGDRISIQFEYEGNLYESKMQYSVYSETRKEWFVDPLKRNKQYKKFEEKFAIPISDMIELEGKTVMVEVKKAMGKYIYCEIKPFQKVKK